MFNPVPLLEPYVRKWAPSVWKLRSIILYLKFCFLFIYFYIYISQSLYYVSLIFGVVEQFYICLIAINFSSLNYLLGHVHMTSSIQISLHGN